MSYGVGRSSLNNSKDVKRRSRVTEVNTDKHQQGQLISQLKPEAGTYRVVFLNIIKF